MGNPIAFDFTYIFLFIFYLIIVEGGIILTVYFIINAVRYFKHKIKHDKELLNKLDELIRIQTKQND